MPRISLHRSHGCNVLFQYPYATIMKMSAVLAFPECTTILRLVWVLVCLTVAATTESLTCTRFSGPGT